MARSILRDRTQLVVAIDLSSPVLDQGGADGLARLLAGRRSDLRTVVDTIADAADDPRVRALLVRVDHPAASWAHAEELRDAVAAFRRSGKPAVAHAQSFGEAGNGTLAYYVASAFTEIALQPSGDVGLLGIAAETPFVAGLLEKADIVAEVDRRHEYKSAADLLTQRRYTDAHREAVDAIVASHHERLVEAIADGRGLSKEQATDLVDAGPASAEQAVQAGLVDRLAYRDEITATVKAAAGPDAQLVTDGSYRSMSRLRRLWPLRRPAVALIHGQGSIMVGRSRRGPMGQVMGADTVVAGFSQAIRDRRVRAILFRVDSPGGSAVASDAMWRAVVRAREAGKPVVVSMGSVAGSGGYWVSMAADRIVAQPGTLTGSIGVVNAKLVTRALKERFGLTTDEAHRGTNALMRSANHPLTDEQRRINADMLDRIYDEFVRKVADGRRMTYEEVHDVARGRVWTGADAAERGLVDVLGGYTEALSVVRELLALQADAPLRLRSLPRRRLAERLGIAKDNIDDLTGVIEASGAALRSAGIGTGTATMSGWHKPVQ